MVIGRQSHIAFFTNVQQWLEKVSWNNAEINLLLRRLSQLFNPLLGRTRSRDRCWAVIRMSHHPEPSGRAVHVEVGGLGIGGQHGRRFALLRHTHKPQRGHTAFVQAGAEMSDTGVEAVKPEPRFAWKGHSGRVDAGVGDESAESRNVVQPLRFPLVIRPGRRTYVIAAVRWIDELLCGGYKRVSRFVWDVVHWHPENENR